MMIHSNIHKIASMMIGLLMTTTPVLAQSSTSKIYYVTAEAKAEDNHTGSSWDDAMTLQQALEAAVAGDEIRVKGYTALNQSNMYIVPNEEGFCLKSGVKLKGGYTGEGDTRSPKGKSRYDYTYQSALVGDIKLNDEVSLNTTIFPENKTREDNAVHVLTVDMGVDESNPNTNNETTLVEGFVIAGGNASSTEGDTPEGQGGGIYVSNGFEDDNKDSRKYDINECFFVNNFGRSGGAIYVDATATNESSYIRNCGFYNNASGTRSSNENNAGGVYLAGAGVIFNSVITNNINGGLKISAKAKVLNCTVIHNTVSAVDFASNRATGTQPANGGGTVYNSVLWGSEALYKTLPAPIFRYCAHLEVQADDYGKTDANGNLKISANNFSSDASTWFVTPTSVVGYDRSFNTMQSVIPTYSYELEQRSALIGAGSLADYKNILGETTENLDLGNKTRFQDNTIDIGAYERERLLSGRRLYVKPQATGTGDGSSWDNAMSDLQAAINKLADSSGKKGEVWVAAGKYTPTRRIGDASATNVPQAFQMKDGISVYGGFAGNETSIAARKMKYSDKLWSYENETILQGQTTGGTVSASWNSNEESWKVSSKSTHVVWMAPALNQPAFTMSTLLDGCTIQGGSSEGNSELSEYHPDRGAGVYMADANATIRGCTVRYNNAGMNKINEQASANPRGGGIYCKNGQIRYCLVYNNSAAEGGGIYLEDMGFIYNSMIANNSGVNGGGVYLCKNDAEMPDNYLILTTSIIANNTSTRNGGVYAASPSIVEQNTIVNNYTTNVTNATVTNASYTGGLYIKDACIAINNILWNNTLGSKDDNGKQSSSSSKAQIYTANGSKDKVRFYNNAISDVNSTTWNKMYQTGTYEISSTYLGMAFELGKDDDSNPFKQYIKADDFNNTRGVQSYWTSIDYVWTVTKGSVLRSRGILYSQVPSDLLFKPCTDFLERNFEANPPMGAYIAEAPSIVFDKTLYTSSKPVLRLHFDPNNATPDGDGSSWTKEYTSMNELTTYLSTLQIGDVVKVSDGNNIEDYTLGANDYVEIACREGEYSPNTPYLYQESEAKAKTFNIKPTVFPLYILGGYPAKARKEIPEETDRKPYEYRTEFTGNPEGNDLSEGIFHVARIEAGSQVTLDGVVLTKGYASGLASIQRGAGVLIGSVAPSNLETKVTLKDCIIENNTAETGAAIATIIDAKGIKLSLINCVINNNTSVEESDTIRIARELIDMGSVSSNNTLSLTHVTLINNIGIAPDSISIGNTSFAAGNKIYNYQPSTLTEEGANNTPTLLTLATTDASGAANFSNPTKEVGAFINGNVYLGGNAEFRPLTSSTANDAIINQAQDDVQAGELDINGNDRNLGGAADLGAYEAILPKAGKVIYVRSYNTDWTQTDETEGTPDFNLLSEHPDNIYDGTTWSRAIMGNAICKWKADRTGNDFYVTDANQKLQAATMDNAEYDNAYNASTAKYGRQSGAYGNFFISGSATSGTKGNGNTPNKTAADGSKYNEITNNREEEYISGLQYAVEKAAEWNAQHPDDPMAVWVGAGVYTDSKGFVIRNGVKVYGGFPKDGNPGESDRRPLLSQYVPARKQYESLNKADYETILQIRKESPVYLTKGSKEMWYQEGKPQDGSDYDFIKRAILDKVYQRHYVLYQPDVCIPTWSVQGEDSGKSKVGANQYRYPGFGSYEDNTYYQEYKNVTWDGFSIRHGYTTNYAANRDGGAGVRVFRGINLENLIIVNNIAHGIRSRGGGLYMDGDNSVIKNSYLLQNMTACSAPGAEYNTNGVSGNKDSYGGGAYMLTGTGYNMVVASNRSYNAGGAARGGGIFIESATFYNNTVAYNQCVNGAGIEHWQDMSTGISSKLTLYNCLVFENFQDGGRDASQIESLSTSNFRAEHCFIAGANYPSDLITNGVDGNIVATGNNIVNPFAQDVVIGYTNSSKNRKFSDARLNNDYRLNENSDNKCLNNGTEDLPDMPNTDMDYTNRIKDCAIDIGAYEADNTANITYQTKKNVEDAANHADIDDYVYYVTQNGYGNRSGNSPENAACADKLQSVLTVAGELAAKVNAGITDNDKKHKVYVKVAGYAPDDNGERFVYHANTLADANDPRSYTFLIPDGVWLMGGYNEGEYSGTDSLTVYNWDDNKRDVASIYQTILSAKTQPKLGSVVDQEVNGYHTVTFGKWPTGTDVHSYNQEAVKYRAVIDGVHIIDGEATDNAGFKAMGGAAIVPMRAHVRNCIVMNNQAIKGGGLCLLPGAMATGCLMHNNEARQGGAIYAVSYNSDEGTALNFHAYAVSCTIAENTATEGGGIYQELGALMGGNLVVWGNTASTDKNISGVVDVKFQDSVLGAASKEGYYPYNECFVERYLLPANTRNTEMTNDLETYFSDNGTFIPRAYSSLIGQGVTTDYNNHWIQTAGVLTYDILGHDRQTANNARLTAGAYGMATLTRSPNQLLTRLFVSEKGGKDVSDEVKQKYLGRSFYTPFNSLDAALDYIREVRKTKKSATSDETVATDSTKFEILLTGGTYRPATMREGDNAAEDDPTDRRLNSFVIPPNVSIYGGFMSTDPFSSNLKDVSGTDQEDLTEIMVRDTIKVTGLITDDDKDKGSIAEVLHWRNTQVNHMTDLNKNGLIEPWEFSDLTVFSGDIKASAKEKNVYHVVYSRIPQSSESSKARNNDVLLDGIAIMNGQTKDDIAYLKDENGEELDEEDLTSDIGHGGGIYSYNVSYTLNRCYIVNNSAVHGGGIYVQDGSLDIINSVVAGNVAGSESNLPGVGSGHGGGVCMYLTKSEYGNLHAVNSLFANNEATLAGRTRSMGGAIYVRRAEDLISYQEQNQSYHDVWIMNCIVAKNKAQEDAAIRLIRTDNEQKTTTPPIAIHNTVFWNNDDENNELSGDDMEYSASDKLKANPRDNKHNVSLDSNNMTASGPRFANATTQAGKAGFDMMAQWNPAAISVLTDAGNGTLAANVTDQRKGTGAYFDWWELHNPRLYNVNYDNDEYNYIDKAKNEQERVPTYYSRYMGAQNEDGTEGDKTIDIGMYEFQYNFSFADKEAVYIGTEGKGDEDGRDWNNRSTDLRGAIIAMSHPSGNTGDEQGGEQWTQRKIYVMGGEYFSPSLSSTGDAFTLQVNKDQGKELLSSLEIVGSCTGQGLGDNAERNFANPTILIPNEDLEEKSNTKTNILLNVTTNGKPVKLSGITFKNHVADGNDTTERKGLFAALTSDDDAGKLTLENCAFRQNKSYGLLVEGNNIADATTDKNGKLLVYNTLFADGESDGLHIDATYAQKMSATIVNATFAQNKGYDIQNNSAEVEVYNSVSWQNDNSIMGTTAVPAATSLEEEPAPSSNFNKKFVEGQANEDIMTGPNFADPTHGDYSIRPSRMLLNKGSNEFFMQKAMEKTTWTEADQTSLRDLYHHKRFTGKSIDVGAAESNSLLQPIIYVKSVADEGTGDSWNSPVNDLKTAISLAGVYANTNQSSPYGYVFADRSVNAENVLMNLPGVKVYGSMDGIETSENTVTEESTREQIESIVKEVLNKRKGLIEQSATSSITGLTMDFKNSTINNGNETETITSVVDGFEINGTNNQIKNGYLSTSVIDTLATLTAPTAEEGNGQGVLYNTLALGRVTGNVRSVNVTAVKNPLPEIAGNAANRTAVIETNPYVGDDYWRYQLVETSTDINAYTDYTSTSQCAAIVGHNFDLAGNTRIHYKNLDDPTEGVRDVVDNGCFETWKLLQSYQVSARDYPHGKSVIYVTKEDDESSELDPITHAHFHELRLDKDLYPDNSQFSPGFLLLQHHAGLRGCGAYISLNNFAIEREIQEGHNDLCVIPFLITRRTIYQDGISLQDGQDYYSLKLYDGAKRAQYDYQFGTTEDKAAWLDYQSTESMTQGMMVTASKNETLRAYGSDYKEDPNTRSVSLKQFNNQDPWANSSTGTTKFTHKENMGWNLFGSPFLCAMNYQDFQYGRMIYPFDSKSQQFMNPIYTDSDDGGIGGYIPALDAVFTQTATLSSYESFAVKHSEELSGTAYENNTESLALALSSKNQETRSAGHEGSALAEEVQASDQIRVNAVPSEEARIDFDLNSDGVKWMTSHQPQLYIERNGGRYSLLSAVNIEGSLNIGVSLPEAGEYSLSIPEGYDDSKYETIWLKDAETGKAVDLLEGNYTFQATAAGEINNRFSISFNRMLKDVEDGIVITASAGGNIQIKGCQAKDQIRVYVASGLLATQQEAQSATETVRTTATGTLIVEVTRQGKQVAVRKLAVK